MSQVRVLYRPPFRKNAIHSGCVFLCPQFLTGNGVLYPSTRREIVKQVRPQKFYLSKSLWGGQRSTSVVARSASEGCNAAHFCNSKKQGGQPCSACHKKYKLQKSFCFFADFCKQLKIVFILISFLQLKAQDLNYPNRQRSLQGISLRYSYLRSETFYSMFCRFAASRFYTTAHDTNLRVRAENAFHSLRLPKIECQIGRQRHI